ncbi:hypothetical protein O181_073202 [Austropuccinia psidii MF-1]|uniref:Uncharacterized protein n=1 Tax=Austropuccinia psidii MF-1 TaxID=1389203 RepID=A0A9Q3IAU1_9BASI|nr:hypothetical protein [Austropuccinia psidii MF-1]
MSRTLDENEGTRIPNTQVLDSDNSQLKHEFSPSFHNLKPSMGQELWKEVQKLKEWSHFSGEGEYDHVEFIRDKHINTKVELGGKPKIINKWANDSWRFKVKKAFEYAKFNSDKYKALPWFFQQKDRLTALYPDMLEFMIHRKILRQCGGDLENSVKRRTTEQSSEEDIINILEEVTTRTKIGSSRVNLKERFNTPWKDSVEKNPKENSNNVKYKPADLIRKCHICQSTTHVANTFPKRGEINEIDIEKEPEVEKGNNIKENPDDKSSIFSEYSKDKENINATFDIMESYSHLPQLSNGQLDLSKIQD